MYRGVIRLVVPWIPGEDHASRARLEARLAVLEAFVESSTDALFSQDTAGLVTSWSRSAERVFGYSGDEIVGCHVASLFVEHAQPEIAEVLDTVAAGDGVQRYELEARRRDGLPVFVSLSVSPLFDPAGRPAGSVSVAQDITEKRLAQASLAEVEARLREGEALAHVGRWLWDVGTGAVQWSEEFHRLHGVEPLVFAGTFEAYMLCIEGADRNRVAEAMRAAVASGRPFEDEYGVAVPGGVERRIYARAEPMVDSSGVVVGLRGIGQDVTARR
jgi:PAS domain S-box-containing protein